ncbi:MAG TPA: PKD domain-containing protein [Candidatus Angelobacter sp.]|nr:PKD domain-containing protein [Candidatus Angelobacter sp.]
MRVALAIAMVTVLSVGGTAGFYLYSSYRTSPQRVSVSPLSTSLTASTLTPDVNVPVTFTATTRGGTTPYSISWSFGDGSAGSGNITSHKYKSTGSFTTTENVTDSGSPIQTARASLSFAVTSSPSPPSTCSDPASISNHVYNPYRLQIVKACTTASGTVDNIIAEDDGDVHLRLRLDAAYSNLTNSANDQYQYGDLVVEIICVYPPIQADAVASCQNYTNPIPVPDVGNHITVTGPYVLDTEHYDWAEIHPVYSLVITASQGTTINVTGANLNISYPGGSVYGWLGPTPRPYSGWQSVTVNTRDQFTATISLYSTSSSSEQILSIATSTPGFSIISVSPNTPITFDPYATVDITVTIQTPTSGYDGSIDLEITAS